MEFDNGDRFCLRYPKHIPINLRQQNSVIDQKISTPQKLTNTSGWL
ncbi:hypothetical protein H6G36_19715 [Anabaena minutissima FACHB-250]|nr:hypothetical protein [Anabaena minutissima FACHB-250]